MSLTTFIRNASKNQVLTGLTQIKASYLPSNSLLDPANLLGADGAQAIADHFNGASIVNISQDDARTFLGASAYMHCHDGWQYLSHAIEALIRGDLKIAIHLAYYAELRAAMSFLASEGVGVFDKVHFCQEQNGTITKDPKSQLQSNRWWRGKGTHMFVWDCLDTWISDSNKSATDLLNGLVHNGFDFATWISHIPNAGSLRITNLFIKDWLKKWTFDIQNYTSDREGRNFASYRPSIVNSYSPHDITQLIKSYSDILLLTEPNGSNRFSLLDKYLFKILFHEIHTEIVRNGGPISLTDLLDQTFQNARKPMDLGLRQLITTNQSHVLFTSAANTVLDSSGNIQPLTILSRALLMLRITSSNVSVLLKAARISKQDVNFFTDYFGIENGFWKPGDTFADYEELWPDLHDSIIDLNTWLDSQADPICLKNLCDQKPGSLATIKQINRASLWGIAI